MHQNNWAEICQKAYKQFTKQESFWFFYAECICDLTVKCTQLMFVDFTPAVLILQVTNTVSCVSLSDAYTQIFFLDLTKIGVLSPMISGYRRLFQYNDVSYQYRDPHVKNQTGTTVLSLTWESPYLGKTVFILGQALCMFTHGGLVIHNVPHGPRSVSALAWNSKVVMIPTLASLVTLTKLASW